MKLTDELNILMEGKPEDEVMAYLWKTNANGIKRATAKVKKNIIFITITGEKDVPDTWQDDIDYDLNDDKDFKKIVKEQGFKDFSLAIK